MIIRAMQLSFIDTDKIFYYTFSISERESRQLF